MTKFGKIRVLVHLDGRRNLSVSREAIGTDGRMSSSPESSIQYSRSRSLLEIETQLDEYSCKLTEKIDYLGSVSFPFTGWILP